MPFPVSFKCITLSLHAVEIMALNKSAKVRLDVAITFKEDDTLLLLIIFCLFFCADPAIKAADICFKHANTKGNLFGNCGITSGGKYIKCSVA